MNRPAAALEPVTPSAAPSAAAWPLRLLRSPAARALFIVAMTAGTALIALAVTDYLDDGLLHPFIREKRATGHAPWWLAALGTHVVAALVAFPLCLLLLSRRLLRAAPRAHRVLGRLNGVVVLLLLVPSGFVLSTTARGGWAGAAGFVVSGVVTAVAMVRAIVTARRRDVPGHRRAIAHVVAQLSVAVSSRVLLVVAGVVLPAVGADLDPDAVYVAVLWLPVVAGAAVAHVVVPVARAVPAVAAVPEPGAHHAPPRLVAVPGLQPAR